VDAGAEHVAVAVRAEVAVGGEVGGSARAVGDGGAGVRERLDRRIVGVVHVGDERGELGEYGGEVRDGGPAAAEVFEDRAIPEPEAFEELALGPVGGGDEAVLFRGFGEVGGERQAAAAALPHRPLVQADVDGR